MSFGNAFQSIYFLSLIFIFVNSTCSNSPGGGKLDGTAWKLQSVSEGSTDVEMNTYSDVTIGFEEDKLNGKGFCNQYFAEYSTEHTKIRIGPVGATKMMCPKFMDLEQTYFELLPQAETYSVKGDVLEIYCGKGKLIYRRVTKNIEPSEDGQTQTIDGIPDLSGACVWSNYPQDKWQRVAIN